MEVSGKDKFVLKSDGTRVAFDPEKLRSSLQRADASLDTIEWILADLLPLVTDGMKTREIYSQAFRRLRTRSRHAAGRYKLKRAIFDLGPSGYPFEQFIGRLLTHEGFTAEVGTIKPGRCVTHEVDVWAYDDKRLRIVECKFHRDIKSKSSIQTALYVQARFEDLQKQLTPPLSGLQAEAYIVTNTRFTTEAMRYGNCMGMRLVSWDEPKGASLKNWIDKSGLHPLTCLSSLNKAEKSSLLAHGKVLCRELDAQDLIGAGIPYHKHARILAECASIVESR